MLNLIHSDILISAQALHNTTPYRKSMHNPAIHLGLGVTNEKCIRIIKTNIMLKAGPEIIKQEIIKLLSCSTQLTAQNLK